MKEKSLVSSQIEEFYTRASEETRLREGLGPLEFERNKDLIQRFLPEKGGTIVDVGGGPGLYSAWMAEMGYKVFLIDPIFKHIQQAQKRSGKLTNKFVSILGEAQTIGIPDNTADLVIVHGPLYHLQRKQDRVRAIQEAKRIVKENGIILGFAINYVASTIVGLLQGLIYNKDYFSMCKAELTSGKHDPPASFPGLLTEAYFHRPDELKQEFLEEGLQFINIFAVEGMVWLTKNYFEIRADAEKYKTLMEILRITENDINLISYSPHVMIAARK